MQIHHYVINLDRSADRLAAISRDMQAVGIDLIRVPAVDGKTVLPEDRVELDEAGFQRWHGKRPMAGEYGCYISHLRAIEMFAASGADFAAIFEDDIVPQPTLTAALAALAAGGDWDIARLAHHRAPRIVATRDLSGGHRLGTSSFGPSGSSAAYMLRREAVPALRRGLLPMRLPYDVALERGWAYGLRVLDVSPDPVRFNRETKKSLTKDEGSYASRKLKPWQRLTTLRFRSLELARRAAYVAKSLLR